MKSRKGEILTFSFLLGWLFLFVFGCYSVENVTVTDDKTADSVSDPIYDSEKTIVESTLPLSEIWRVNIDLPHSDISSGLLASNDYLAFVSYNDNNQYILKMLSAISGDSLWAADIPPIDSMIMDEVRIYVAVDWMVQAYEISTGNLLWQSEQLPQHTSYRFHPNIKEKVLVYSTEDYFDKREQVLRYYDVQDGALESVRQEIPTDEWLVLRQLDVDFWAKKDNKVWGISKPTNILLWEFDVNQQYNNTPLLTDSMIFFLDGPFPDLKAVDVRDGILAWTYNEEIVSNAVINQSTLYALNINNTLIGLDSDTGREVGYIKFENSTKMTPETDVYWIAVTDNNAFIYFGDSKELIAFTFVRP